MTSLWDLFFTFARIGLFTFGGGYAMLPMIQKEVVEKKQWATEQQVLDYYALGQATPGIIAVNTATFIGYEKRGVIGGIMATLGMIFPSLVIIMTIATFIAQAQEMALVQHAFRGIRIAVVVLILSTVVKLAKRTVKTVQSGVLFAAALLLILVVGVSPALVVIGAAALGAGYAAWTAGRSAEREGGGKV